MINILNVQINKREIAKGKNQELCNTQSHNNEGSFKTTKIDRIKNARWIRPTRGGHKEQSGGLFFIFTSGEPPLEIKGSAPWCKPHENYVGVESRIFHEKASFNPTLHPHLIHEKY